MVFWVTPFVLRHLHLWPVEGSVASTAGLFVFFFLANLFSVAVMISGGSMIADIVEASEVQTGRRSEGTFFAGNFFIQKCATGVGMLVTGDRKSVQWGKSERGRFDLDGSRLVKQKKEEKKVK